MAEFASKGTTGTALGLGIAGTTLGLLNSNGNGILGGFLGGNSNQTTGLAETLLMVQAINGNNSNGGCSENTPATRWNIEQSEKMAGKDAEIAALRVLGVAKDYTDAAVVDLRNQIKPTLDTLNARSFELEKYAAVNTTKIGCMQNEIDMLQSIGSFKVNSANVCDSGYPVQVQSSACNPVYTHAVSGK